MGKKLFSFFGCRVGGNIQGAGKTLIYWPSRPAGKNVTLDPENYLTSDSTNFSKNVTIGGYGHENWVLLRFLPLLIGHCIPENEKTWPVVPELKDIVELLSSHSFTTDTLCYLQARPLTNSCFYKYLMGLNYALNVIILNTILMH